MALSIALIEFSNAPGVFQYPRCAITMFLAVRGAGLYFLASALPPASNSISRLIITTFIIYKFLRFFIHTLSDSVQWGIFTPNVALILLLSSTE